MIFSMNSLNTPRVSSYKSPDMRLTPPRRAKRRIAGLVMPSMLLRRTLRCRTPPPFPNPNFPFPSPDMFDFKMTHTLRVCNHNKSFQVGKNNAHIFFLQKNVFLVVDAMRASTKKYYVVDEIYNMSNYI